MPIPNCGRYPAPRFTRPRRCAWDNGEIDRAAAALRARQARGPCRNREVGAVARGLLVGVDIDPVLAALAPDAQQQMRVARAAERRRARGAFVTLTLHGATRISGRADHSGSSMK